MANLSSAFGEITFRNKDKSDLAKFIYITSIKKTLYQSIAHT